jgi:curved DNA-binding protein
MAWQPPPPPPRPGSGSPSPSQRPGTTAPPSGEQQQRPQAETEANKQGTANKPKDLNYYELLQVDHDAHQTIIRYAYRFLAAMYHPDNGETGNAEKFRIISEAWRTLSDDGRRAAYDLSLGVKEQAQKQAQKSPETKAEFGRQSLPNVPKTTLTWNEIELRLAVLQVLLAAKKQRPNGGGASGKMLMDCLNIDNVTEIEFALWYLREKGLIEMGERSFVITAMGVDYLTDQLSRTEILGEQSAMEKKTGSVVGGAGLPALRK